MSESAAESVAAVNRGRMPHPVPLRRFKNGYDVRFPADLFRRLPLHTKIGDRLPELQRFTAVRPRLRMMIEHQMHKRPIRNCGL